MTDIKDVIPEVAPTIIATLLIFSFISLVVGSVIHAEGTGTRESAAHLSVLLREIDDIKEGVPLSGTRAVPDFFVDDGFFVVGFDMDAAAVYDACEQRQMSRPKECIPGKACVCYCAQGTDCKPVSSCRSFERIKRLRTYNLPTGNFLGSEQQDGGRQLIAYGDCSWRYPQLPPTTVYVYATTINNERVAIINGASPALQTTQVDLSKPQS